MGRRIMLNGTTAHPPHGVGTILTYNSGVSHVEIVSEPPGGNEVRWQTGGDDNIWLYPNTVLRPLEGSQAGVRVFIVQSDGYLRFEDDPNPKTLPAPPPPAPEPSVAPYQTPRPDVIQLAPSQYTGKTAAQLIADAGGGYVAFGPLDNQMELVRLDSSVLPLYQAKYATIAPPPPIVPITPAIVEPGVTDSVLPPVSVVSAPSGAAPAEQAIAAPVASEGVPVWAWIAGGAVALWLVSRPSGRR